MEPVPPVDSAMRASTGFLAPRWLVAASALACSLTVALGLSACSKREAAPEPLRAVRTVTIGTAAVGGSHEYAAEVRARVESRLGLRVPGKLVQRSVEVGQRVQAGQVLARVDTADLRLAQQAAAAATRAAQTAVDLAAAEYGRYQELRAQGFIGQLELERREATLKQQQAVLEQARAQSQVQANQAGYGALTAPAAGVVLAVEAEVGAVLAAGTPVLRLAHDGPRDAVFAVPEDQWPVVRALLGRAGALKVRPWGAAAPLTATVREVAAAADPVTRTFLVKADLAGKSTLQLGQTLTVLIDLPESAGAIKVPLTALTQQQGQTAVWVVEPGPMTVRPQTVTVGGADGDSVVIASGLQAGQRVVTAGVHTLAPGQKVSYYAEPTSALAPAATATTAAVPR